MNRAEHCLHVFGHALAAHALYGAGHHARDDAGTKLYSALEALLATDARPTFTFLGEAVLYRSQPIHGLKEWVWSKRLGAAGIRRLEFSPQVSRAAVGNFLATVHQRLGGENRGATLGWPGIEAGDVAVAGPEHAADPAPPPEISLGAEVAAVRFAFGRAALGERLPLADLDAVVRALTVALHSEGELLVPLLALETLDDHASLHAVNTAVLTMTFCEWLGLAGGDIRAVGKAALLHDIGMALVPKDVFTTRTVSPSTREDITRHPEAGARLLLSRSSQLDLAATSAYEHHLQVDGQGYPARRFHRDLHYISRLISVCGAYDALRSERAYRPALPAAEALGTIETRAGTVYDAGVAQAFVQMMGRWENRIVTARAS